ncbi:MAG: copper resistance protein NlpE [Chitinophagaceae bacterium]|nr:copper resistance protein NlpE [Chitinophagaceae bacterium]
MKRILLPACVILLFVACNSSTEASSDPEIGIDPVSEVKTGMTGEPDAGSSLLSVFEGVLPCADCEGIRMELTLYQDIANADNNNYILKETYLGVNTADTVFTSKGSWGIIKGIKTDKEASVFVLNYDSPDESRYFLKENDSTIVMLDQDQNKINSALNYSLHKR